MTSNRSFRSPSFFQTVHENDDFFQTRTSEPLSSNEGLNNHNADFDSSKLINYFTRSYISTIKHAPQLMVQRITQHRPHPTHIVDACHEYVLDSRNWLIKWFRWYTRSDYLSLACAQLHWRQLVLLNEYVILQNVIRDENDLTPYLHTQIPQTSPPDQRNSPQTNTPRTLSPPHNAAPKQRKLHHDQPCQHSSSSMQSRSPSVVHGYLHTPDPRESFVTETVLYYSRPDESLSPRDQPIRHATETNAESTQEEIKH